MTSCTFLPQGKDGGFDSGGFDGPCAGHKEGVPHDAEPHESVPGSASGMGLGTADTPVNGTRAVMLMVMVMVMVVAGSIQGEVVARVGSSTVWG